MANYETFILASDNKTTQEPSLTGHIPYRLSAMISDLSSDSSRKLAVASDQHSIKSNIDIHQQPNKVTWMGDIIQDMFPDARLGEFLLPGSHNSAAIDFYQDSCPAGPSSSSEFVLPPLPNRALLDTAKTQEFDLMHQLEVGGMRLIVGYSVCRCYL
jgi:hypothetical protein